MLNLEMAVFPVLHTERLVLRQMRTADAPALHLLRSDPEGNRYIDRPPSTSVDDALAFIQKIKEYTQAQQGITWIITLAGDDNLIGSICFWNYDKENDTIELGYELATAYQGRGYMAEAVTRVIQYGFEQMNAGAINATCTADNERSLLLLKKFGFAIDPELQAVVDTEEANLLGYSLKA